MPNPKLETYKNKATGTVYDYTDAAAQAALAGILDGTDIGSFEDVETALATKVDKVTGKGLSTNDYDNTAKGIVDNIQSNVIANTKLIKDTVGWSGKNLLPITSSSMVLNGITVTKKEKNILHFEGTATTGGCSYTFGTGNANKKFYAGKYKLTYEVEGTTDASSPAFTRSLKSEDGTTINTDWNVIGANDTNKVKTVEVTGTDYFDSNRIWIPAGRTVNCDVKVMILDPDILDLSYEPYFGSTAFPRSEQAVLGAKNLLTWWKRYKTGNNIEFTVNNDDTVTVVVETGGTSSTVELLADDGKPQNYMFLADDLRKNPCILSNTGFYDSNVFVEAVYRTSENTFISDERLTNVAEKRLTIPANAYYVRFAVYVKNGTPAGTYMLKPMLRLASDPDSTYAPHAMTNKELTDSLAVKTLVPTLESTDFTFTADTKVLVSGNVVSVNFAITGGSLPINTTKKIMTLPAGYKPSYLMHGVAYVKDASTPAIRVFVDSSRQVSLLSPLAAVENKDIFGSITFINS